MRMGPESCSKVAKTSAASAGDATEDGAATGAGADTVVGSGVREQAAAPRNAARQAFRIDRVMTRDARGIAAS
jgi:hypothetical protein